MLNQNVIVVGEIAINIRKRLVSMKDKVMAHEIDSLRLKSI